MRFWFLLFIALCFFTVNTVPEAAHAKTGTVKKTTAKKSTKKKKSAAKPAKRKAAMRVRRTHGGRSIALLPAYAPRYSEFLVDGDSGRILHQENANDLRYPASLTKMMTIYLTFEQLKAGNLKLNQNLRVSAYASSMPKTNLSLTPDTSITVKEALLGLVVHSANDAAVVLAENIGGDEDSFARMMTQRARQLGMSSTTFKNACGLHDPGQVTTARDMALLAIALKKHYPEYYPMFARTEFDFHGRTYEGHNRVTRDYAGAEGMKTGYVRASGFNLVTSATHSEGNLVGVVMGGRTAATRDERMKQLLDAGFEKLADMKKKDNSGVAQKSADDDGIDVASLEPRSGGKPAKTQNKVAAKTRNDDARQTAVANDNSADDEEDADAGVEAGMKDADFVKPAAIAKKGKPLEPKHFANQFVPQPKGKPSRTASLEQQAQ